MELISYANIPLDVVQTRDVRRDVIMSDDGVDYLWTDHYIDVIVTYNPGATNYAVDGDGVVRRGPGGRRGWLAGVTDTSIRHILSQPRQRLLIKAAGATILDTPREGEPCDANNGPSCKVISIQKITGDKTFTMHLQFKASVNECPPHQRQVALSNRWKAVEDVDELHNSVRTISGTLILNAGVAGRLRVTPDSLRSALFFPVPPNFQRQNVHVEASSDGNRLTYSFQDRLQNFNLGADSPAITLEVEPFGHYSEGSIGQMLSATAAGTFQNAFGNFGQQGPAALFTAAPMAAMSAVRSNLPSYTLGCTAKATGNRDSSIRNLARLAMGACLSRLGINGANPFNEWGLGQTAIDSFQSHGKRYAQVTITYRFGADSTFWKNVAGAINGQPSWRQWLNVMESGNETITDAYSNSPRVRNAMTQDVRIPNPVFPNDNGTRGSSFVRLVTQLLTFPCQPPPLPPRNQSFDPPRRQLPPSLGPPIGGPPKTNK